MRSLYLFILMVVSFYSNAQIGSQDVFYNENDYLVVIIPADSVNNLMSVESSATVNFSSKNLITINSFPTKDNCLPIGLLISGKKKVNSLNLNGGGGNFFLKPNAVFSISKSGKVEITESTIFKRKSFMAFQSGPAMILKSVVHPAFNYFSKNLNFRSAIGLFKDDKGVEQVILAVSKKKVNLFDMAEMLLNRFGCDNAVSLQSGNCFLTVNGVKWSSNQPCEQSCHAIVFRR